MVRHIGVERIHELGKLQGSKYVQSQMGSIYLEVKEKLNRGKIVYFSGTPCQVDGLIAFLGKEYDNLICQDIICHGVPSPKIWKQYLKQFNIEKMQKFYFVIKEQDGNHIALQLIKEKSIHKERVKICI